MTTRLPGTRPRMTGSDAGNVAVHSGAPVAAETASTCWPFTPSSVPPANVRSSQGAPCQSTRTPAPDTSGSFSGATGAGVVTATLGGAVDADAGGRVKPQPAVAAPVAAMSAHATTPLHR